MVYPKDGPNNYYWFSFVKIISRQLFQDLHLIPVNQWNVLEHQCNTPSIFVTLNHGICYLQKILVFIFPIFEHPILIQFE